MGTSDSAQSVGILLLFSMLVSSPACTWVAASPGGKLVRVETPAQVSGCERLGMTHVTTQATIGVVERSIEAIREELQTLARNEAARMGGDRVAAESAVEDGRQTFGVYRCDG